MKIHRVRQIIHILLLSVVGVFLISHLLVFSVNAENESDVANTPVGIRFIRPVEPSKIEDTDITPEHQELLETQHHYIEKGFLPQTGVRRNLLLIGIGYLLVVFTSIQFFKGRNMRS